MVQWIGITPANGGDVGSISGVGRLHMLRKNEACEPQLPSPRSATGEATSEKPDRCSRVASARRNFSKPARSSEDPVQPKINKGFF